MAFYIITYEIRSKEHDHTKLYEQLFNWRASHLQNSVWLATLDLPASEIRNTLIAQTHPEDTVCVVEIKPASNWATRNARPDGVQFLKSTIHP
ncbi:MAG: hypothetical protein WA840_23065 [Caulobacteraceae bacterium]